MKLHEKGKFNSNYLPIFYNLHHDNTISSEYAWYEKDL